MKRKTNLTAILQSRIDEAQTILKSFYKSPEITITHLMATLENMGIDDSEIGLKILESPSTTWEDFSTALSHTCAKLPASQHNNKPIPLPRVKIAWMILQGKDPFKEKEVSLEKEVNESTMSKLLVELKPIGQWSDLELLSKYGWQCAYGVEEELLKRSKSRPVIVFNDDGKINVDCSMTLLRHARVAETPTTFVVNDLMKPVYKIGHFPMNVAYECPVHSNILLLDGYCEECGFKWSDFESNKEKHVFLRMLSMTTKIEPVALRTYIKLPFEELVKLFPKIYMQYINQKEEEKLPTLKRRLSKNREGDPLRVVHTTY